jgi:hypothetical protein
VLEIGDRDLAAVPGHFRGEALRGLPLVKFARPVLRDAIERLRELGLDERVADLVERAVLLEDALRFG